MSFGGHFSELRTRLIVSLAAVLVLSVLSYVFYDRVIGLLTAPFKGLHSGINSQALFINSIYEGFTVRIKISFVSGLVLSLPVLIFNLLQFIFPGLTPKERRVILYSLIASFVLLAAGAYYGYSFMIPVLVGFFLKTGFLPDGIGVLLNFDRNIFYILQFLLLTVLVFQLPILLELLMIMNILKRKAVFKASRIIIVLIFVLAAVMTPSPDAFSQLAVALPLTALFLLTLLVAEIFKFGGET